MDNKDIRDTPMMWELELTPEQVEILKRTKNGELHIDVPEMPAARLPEMSEREQIDCVHISHATRHLFPRNDV